MKNWNYPTIGKTGTFRKNYKSTVSCEISQKAVNHIIRGRLYSFLFFPCLSAVSASPTLCLMMWTLHHVVAWTRALQSQSNPANSEVPLEEKTHLQQNVEQTFPVSDEGRVLEKVHMEQEVLVTVLKTLSTEASTIVSFTSWKDNLLLTISML